MHHHRISKRDLTLREPPVLGVQGNSSPNTGASPSTKQKVEIPAVGALAGGGAGNRLQRWQVPVGPRIGVDSHGDISKCGVPIRGCHG